MYLGEIAQWFGSAGQYIGEHRLRLGRAGFGGLPRPGQSGGEVRLTGLVIGKQSVGLAGLDALCEAVHAQRREQTLGFEMPTASRGSILLPWSQPMLRWRSRPTSSVRTMALFMS